MHAVTEEEFRDHADSFDGLCLSCGEWSEGGIEPDAEGYVCEGCGEPMVEGAENALISGHLTIQ